MPALLPVHTMMKHPCHPGELIKGDIDEPGLSLVAATHALATKKVTSEAAD
jgi:plasmid maintenance system antidote protein VapI